MHLSNNNNAHTSIFFYLTYFNTHIIAMHTKQHLKINSSHLSVFSYLLQCGKSRHYVFFLLPEEAIQQKQSCTNYFTNQEVFEILIYCIFIKKKTLHTGQSLNSNQVFWSSLAEYQWLDERAAVVLCWRLKSEEVRRPEWSPRRAFCGIFHSPLCSQGH